VERIENCAYATRRNSEPHSVTSESDAPLLDRHDYKGWARVPGSTALDVASRVVEGSLGFGCNSDAEFNPRHYNLQRLKSVFLMSRTPQLFGTVCRKEGARSGCVVIVHSGPGSTDGPLTASLPMLMLALITSNSYRIWDNENCTTDCHGRNIMVCSRTLFGLEPVFEMGAEGLRHELLRPISTRSANQRVLPVRFELQTQQTIAGGQALAHSWLIAPPFAKWGGLRICTGHIDRIIS
jgi:hypothetical protein